MKKILVLLGVVMLFWSCASQGVTQGSSPQNPVVQKPAGPEPADQKFRGKTWAEVFEAVQKVLADGPYTITSVDKESGLITAAEKAIPDDGNPALQVTILVFTDAKGITNAEIQIVPSGQAGDISNARDQRIKEIQDALRNILR